MSDTEVGVVPLKASTVLPFAERNSDARNSDEAGWSRLGLIPMALTWALLSRVQPFGAPVVR